MRPDAVNVARSIWRDINGKNLVENILPTRERADLILHKEADHHVTSPGQVMRGPARGSRRTLLASRRAPR